MSVISVHKKKKILYSVFIGCWDNPLGIIYLLELASLQPSELRSLLLTQETECIALLSTVSRWMLEAVAVWRLTLVPGTRGCPGWYFGAALASQPTCVVICGGLNPRPLHVKASSPHRPQKRRLFFPFPLLWRPKLLAHPGKANCCWYPVTVLGSLRRTVACGPGWDSGNRLAAHCGCCPTWRKAALCWFKWELKHLNVRWGIKHITGCAPGHLHLCPSPGKREKSQFPASPGFWVRVVKDGRVLHARPSLPACAFFALAFFAPFLLLLACQGVTHWAARVTFAKLLV